MSENKYLEQNSRWRNTSQTLAPSKHEPTPPGQYDLYPAFPISPDSIQVGYEVLAEYALQHGLLRIDGYVGVFWDVFRDRLEESLAQLGTHARWVDVTQAMSSETEIETLVEPYLGGNDPLFGTRFTGTLVDFFDSKKLAELAVLSDGELTILYGCGAGLVELSSQLVYVDLPKNELQFRSRANRAANLGMTSPQPPKSAYKRFYFVDWIALDKHKKSLLEEIDLFVDGQHPDQPPSVAGETVRGALEQMSHNYFRVRPWFEPGPWGGQWIKENIPKLPQDVPNYAWSFELITPENGLMLEDGNCLFEVSFDWIMAHDNRAVLGDSAVRFGYEFPIRFDYLDTFDGGNLSVQCHPRPKYIRHHFGETFTQDETYYILDCTEDSQVYLGFNEGIDPDAFRNMLEQSNQKGNRIDIGQFVKTVPAQKHDLFLIPSGTIHCSGTNNLVLEISATPYIFTFKMYDWLRMDLEGNPRPLNIDRAFENLHFDRQGDYVEQHLISHPCVLEEEESWRVVHLPTHADHFYDVRRLEFDHDIDCETAGSCQVMCLVEGSVVTLETHEGMRARFNFAETFVVPAAARSFRLINEGDERALVVQAFLKA